MSVSSASSVTRNELRGGQSPVQISTREQGREQGCFRGVRVCFEGFEGGRQEGRERRKEKGMNGKQVKEKEGERGKGQTSTMCKVITTTCLVLVATAMTRPGGPW